MSNWLLSIGEDAFVVGLGLLALNYPAAALVVAGILLTVIMFFFGAIVRLAWRRLFHRPLRVDPSGAT